MVLAVIALASTLTAPLWTGPVYRGIGLPITGGPAPVITVDPGEVAALGSRLSALERQVGNLVARAGPDPATGALAAKLQAIDRRLTEMEDVATPALADRISAMGGAVDALSADLARLDGVVGSQRIALSEARAVLTSLEGRTDEIVGRLNDLADTQRRDGRRIDRLIASDSATQALVLSVGQLRVSVDAGRPFAQPLAALRGLAAGIEEIADDLASLAPRAATGIPSRDALKGSFPTTAQAVREAVLLSADADWLEQVVARIEGLITVRPAPGEVDGDDVAAVLARAEGRLINADLPGAVAAMAMLEGDAAAAAGAWRRAAEARLAAEGALDRLNGFAIARLANASPDDATP